MGEFSQYFLQGFRSSSHFIQEMESTSMEMTKQTPELSQSIPENFNFSPESFLAHQQYGFPAPTCAEDTLFSTLHSSSCSLSVTQDSVMADENVFHSKRKVAMEQSVNSFQNQNISPAVSTCGFGGDTSNRKMNRLGNGKRGRKNQNDPENSGEVVHVRAKRGQATDSHSISERVRREKINQKMRCLQDLVPGCQQTKGMAVMLDEIINYVHSLQNQVEFLSMELAAASSSYDIKPQGTSTHVTQGMEKWVTNRYGEQNWPL